MGGCDVQFDVFSFVVFVVALFFANKSIPLYIYMQASNLAFGVCEMSHISTSTYAKNSS